MTSTRRVLVFGSINLDLFLHVPRLPHPGETVGGGTFSSAPGGKGANQALAAKRAGAEVALIGAVGEDPYGAEALTVLRRDGVDLSQVAFVSAPTGVAMILVEDGGENLIAVAGGANGLVTGEHRVTAEQVLLCQLELPHAANAEMMGRGRREGAQSLLNLAPFEPEAAAYCGLADVLVANAQEAAQLAAALGLAQGSPTEICRELARRTGSDTIVTLGAAGLAASIGGRCLALPATPVEARDTVGAGDALCGYLADALACGRELDVEALTFAAKAAAVACTRAGAQPAMPWRHEVQSFG